VRSALEVGARRSGTRGLRETIGEVLPHLGSKVILDADAKQFLQLMNLRQLDPTADTSRQESAR
jgi:hypothetical protein